MKNMMITIIKEFKAMTIMDWCFAAYEVILFGGIIVMVRILFL